MSKPTPIAATAMARLLLVLFLIGIVGSCVNRTSAAPSSTIASKKTDAHSATCKELRLSKQSITYTPRMVAPVCYDGSHIWKRGNTSPGFFTIGWTVNDPSWYGVYGDSSRSWIGVGENFIIKEPLPPYVTMSCKPRWIINASGRVISSSYGCMRQS